MGGEVRPEWSVARLSELVEINRTPWEPASGGTIRYLDLSGILEPGRTQEPQVLDAVRAPSRARRQALSGDILVSTVRPYLQGFARVRPGSDALVVSTGFAVLTPRPGIDASFIYHHVMSAAFIDFLKPRMTGSNYPAVRPDDIGDFRVPVPTSREQHAIGSILDAIDEAIEHGEAVLTAAETLRQSLLDELLSNGVPGHHTEWRDLRGVGTVPACWQETTFEATVDLAQGQADPRDVRYRDMRFVAPDDIESGTGVLLTERWVHEAKAISGKYLFRAGDVLFSKIRPYLRKATLATEDGLCSADMYPVTPRVPLDPLFLLFLLLSKHFDAYARTCSDRTGIPKMNRVDLLRYRLALPSLDEQHRIGRLGAATSQLTRGERSALDALRRLKAATSDGLLSGRLRVPRTAQTASALSG